MSRIDENILGNTLERGYVKIFNSVENNPEILFSNIRHRIGGHVRDACDNAENRRKYVQEHFQTRLC